VTSREECLEGYEEWGGMGRGREVGGLVPVKKRNKFRKVFELSKN